MQKRARTRAWTGYFVAPLHPPVPHHRDPGRPAHHKHRLTHAGWPTQAIETITQAADLRTGPTPTAKTPAGRGSPLPPPHGWHSPASSSRTAELADPRPARKRPAGKRPRRSRRRGTRAGRVQFPSAVATALYSRGPRGARRPGHLPRSCVMVLVAPSTAMGTVSFPGLTSGNGSPPFVCAEWSWGDPDLTLGAPRGEVGITEAERSDRVLPGGRGVGPESRACSACSGVHLAV